MELKLCSVLITWNAPLEFGAEKHKKKNDEINPPESLCSLKISEKIAVDKFCL